MVNAAQRIATIKVSGYNRLMLEKDKALLLTDKKIVTF